MIFGGFMVHDKIIKLLLKGLTQYMKKNINIVYAIFREGAYVALMCIWHGTAKDRKAIIKSFKTFMMKTAQEEYGHLVLMGKDNY